MAPKQKERAINELKSLGCVTLMCGDGTNDVGALKHADVGVALLSHPFDATKAEERRKKKEEEVQAAAANAGSAANHLLPSHGHAPVGPSAGGVRRPIGTHSARRNDAPAGARQIRHAPMANTATRRLEQMMKELEEEEKAQVVRLGDASVAAPFTSKYTSIQSSSFMF
ncbi:putative cation-transporting ATPase C10C6.6 [Toxocara canis]|uniref:Putative cation-transporting ATPase C10C6.6 n=1 Tax=Toxocara canis TaxID=6265 RepID=A0A0B2UP87_TOXCA|nr:putative cation-transporting ATPase C10C6.6 [Toxocara canis]